MTSDGSWVATFDEKPILTRISVLCIYVTMSGGLRFGTVSVPERSDCAEFSKIVICLARA
jgi:hypothetical protein